MDEKEFYIRINISDGRLIIEALSDLPFKYVYELIGSINSKANESITGTLDEDTLHTFIFTRYELDLILKSLGTRAHSQVFRLVEKLSRQTRLQVYSFKDNEGLNTNDRI